MGMIIKMKNVTLFMLALAALALPRGTDAATYVVGDSTGWTTSAATYASWASQHTFSPGDVLVFNFAAGVHDVAEVTKASFDSCSSNSPISLQTISPANVTLSKAGQYYFICTFGQHCSLGQKLTIKVTSTSSGPTASPPKSSTPPPTATLTPPIVAPMTSPPIATPPMTSPPMTTAPMTPPPMTAAPMNPPTMAPMSPPAMSPTPGSNAPAGGPTTGSMGPTASSPGSMGANPPSEDTPSPPARSSAPRDVATLIITFILVVMGVVC